MMRNYKRKTRGFTIIEMLLAMTITALLLTALAASINASTTNLKANEESFKVINNARQALSRMTAELRTAEEVDVNEFFDYFEGIISCTFVNAEGDKVSFRWSQSDVFSFKKNILYLRKDYKNYVLCENVTDMSFTKSTFIDDDGDEQVRNVQISMTVKYGDTSKKLATAAVIMRSIP